MDMIDLYDPDLINDFPLQEVKTLIAELKKNIEKEIKDNPELAEENFLDIFLCTVKSLESEISKAKQLKDLSKEKQARVIADTLLIFELVGRDEDFDEDEDFDDEFEDVDDDFEEEDEHSK